MSKENWNLELSQYIKQGESSQVEKTRSWETAIGLQAVDGLQPSKYLIDIAKEHIEGKIDINAVEKKINEYYKVIDSRKDEQLQNSEEADKVAVRIAEILSDNTFSFNPNELISIHRKLFSGIFKHAGKIRNYNIENEEWVLKGDTVIVEAIDGVKLIVKKESD